MKRRKIFAIVTLLILGALSLSLTSCNLQGPQGEQGVEGPKGDTGKDGINGKDGTSVLNGKGKPSYELGNVGDSYIDTDTWDYYVKTSSGWTKEGNIKGKDGTNGNDGNQGAQGVPGKDGHTPVITIGENGNWFIDGVDTNISSKGPKGDKGISGKDGSSVLNGNGIPSNELGDVGDSYIDLDTRDYYTKSSTGWIKQGNIKGDKGIPGKDGSNGKDGTNGETPTIGENGNWRIGGKDTGISSTPTKYIPAIFNNYDGTMLYTFYYEKGTTVSYNGPTPIRPSDYNGEEELPYTFIGWDKSLENIQEPTIYTAQYRGKMYDVTFKNYDGTTLYSTQIERGHDATYVGDIPLRNDNQKLDWIFTGWDKSLTNIIANTTFIAQFYAPNSLKCVFKNYDGTVLSTQYVGTGDNVVYEGTTPTRPDNGEDIITRYEFNGWDRSLENIASDTVFTAQYGTNTYYKVKFVNYDGTILYTTSTFSGGQVTYIGDTPTRPQDASGNNVTDYTFSGWDKSLENITAPTTIKAKYSSSTYTGYLVTFLDSDSTELYSHYFKQGTNANYPYTAPFSYDSTNVHMFVGWNNSIENITGPLTVTAQYMTISRRQNGEYPQSVVTDQVLINSLNTLTTTNSKGYYELGGEQYQKLRAKPFRSNYTFNNGETIIDGTYYYFKVEPIQRRYITDDGNTAFLTSEYLLDSRRYDDNSNNYKNSEIRNWLNNDFLDKAFNDDSLITTTAVDNSVASTLESSNQYICETTYDKIFLLSKAELTKADNGFSTNPFSEDEAKRCQTTEYARAKGARYNMNYNYPYNGYYWTRSPYRSYSNYVCEVKYNGRFGEFSVYDTEFSIRPSLSIKIAQFTEQ